MVGRASGVCFAALWNRMIEPGCTLDVTRCVISFAEIPFQSRLSPMETAATHCDAGMEDGCSGTAGGSSAAGESYYGAETAYHDGRVKSAGEGGELP